jgi:exopolysaccharide biosynthesis polyprenyl glycosylphosphotransferase
MKRSELLFNLLSIPVDALMLLLAGIASFYIRLNSVNLVGPVIYQLELGQLLTLAIKIIPALLLIFAILGLYNLKGTRNFGQEFGRVVLGTSGGLFAIITLFFFNQSLFPSRFIILATWGLGIIFVIIGRLLLKEIQKILFNQGYGLHKLVIINGQNRESQVIQRMLKDPARGYQLIAELDYQESTFQELERLYAQQPFDEIIQTNPSLQVDAVNLRFVEFAKSKGMQFSFVPNLFEMQRNVIEVNDFQGIPVISIKNTPLDGWGKVAKRILDIVASSICLLLTAPFFLAIAVAIKLDSQGKIIYAAPRGGQGRDFRFYKFRSMYTHLSVGDNYGGEEAEKIRQELWKKNDRGGAEGPFLKIKHDPRVTRVGRFIRKTKLDEIPQFWNVLKGDMSMVGPRAHVLDEVGRYRDRYRRMFSIKPGVFGMSQIAQISWPDLPFEEEIRLNTYYIENWSLWLDIKILAKSFYHLFLAKKPKEDY